MQLAKSQKLPYVLWSYQTLRPCLNILLKMELLKICCALGGIVPLLVKLLRPKSRIATLTTSKALSKSEFIPYIPLSLDLQSYNTRDWALEGTKTYGMAFTTKNKPNPQL